MGDGGLLDNGGLPDAIRRGAECTVALGTEKSWISLLVGTDFFGVKNWQNKFLFSSEKTEFFFRLKKTFLLFVFCAFLFYPPKKSKAPKCLGCTKAWLLESFHILISHLSIKIRAPPKGPCFPTKNLSVCRNFWCDTSSCDTPVIASWGIVEQHSSHWPQCCGRLVQSQPKRDRKSESLADGQFWSGNWCSALRLFWHCL